MNIYVVSFAPADENKAATGGFEWRYARADADQEYAEQVANSTQYDGSHIIRLVEVTLPDQLAFPVPTDEGNAKITDWLDSDIDALELTLPALAQFVPEVDDPTRTPTGGVTA